MGKIDIGTVYTVVITLVVVIAITWANIVTLEKSKSTFFVFFARINELLVTVSAIYFVMFSYEALKNYKSFLIEKGSYDKYTIACCIYYGIAQIGILFIHKILKLAVSSRRMIKKQTKR